MSSLRDCFQWLLRFRWRHRVGPWLRGEHVGDVVSLSDAAPQERAVLRSVAREVAGISRKLTYLASTQSFRLAAVSLSYQRIAHRASPSAVWRAAPLGGLTPHCRDRSPKSGSGSRPVPRTAATASGTTSTRPVVPARGESLSAKHFRQALGVEPGDHADHRCIGRPLIDQFGGLRGAVDARDVQRTLSCLRVAPVEAADRQPGRIGRCQVEVGDVDTQMQPGLLVTDGGG